MFLERAGFPLQNAVRLNLSCRQCFRLISCQIKQYAVTLKLKLRWKQIDAGLTEAPEAADVRVHADDIVRGVPLEGHNGAEFLAIAAIDRLLDRKSVV